VREGGRQGGRAGSAIARVHVLKTPRFTRFVPPLSPPSLPPSLPSPLPRKPWSSFVNDKNRNLCSSEALDLLDGLLR
jgi:hypothetical protein